ncbi:FtsX-like permease family protein [Clostridium botulinum]|uniref:FtsX-like permease family protein n=1 Tax=Clostridium botulinum TaxID=1491 RepID=UPI001A91455E|nr:ABC transporter permease [Clostridium botulinum]MBO0527167.1 FtsX-like permease family protein [Clostridium botulinum]MBO0531787.1 FtsX-like permease family protein [Clostridium botulinum]MBO0535371.1 FtsX-like permease family protein [Clostridium botulinum]MBO0540921.1 FtsX-like permease family protein [Clostridium botulinum]MBO0546721.1 FtsX-like permease family protein [Clostridium botulinum]
MYFKIALKNIKKSYKDYSIYFLTLILAVCIFYSFNSIESQKALLAMKYSGKYISRLTTFMSFVSVFVSIILGSLILYANNFLIKKRKKELGIYMILGMGKRKISRILLTETFIVGVISLIAGLILGMGASQGLSAFTIKLFDVPMNEYKFAVSISAIGKTIFYFGIMFLLVMIFNVFVISKYKIIDLLTSGRKNEYIKFKNSFIYLLLFILSVILLVFAYKSILKIDPDVKNPIFVLSIVLPILCTVLFFFSLTGFILNIIKKNKKVYFKGLNIFVVKQINSKVNTHFLSMSLICLMLFITIWLLSTGISFKQVFEAQIEKITPFDASIIVYNNSKSNDIEDILNKINFKTGKNEKYAIYNEYNTKIKVKNLFTDNIEGTFAKISDYNKMLKLKGRKEINLNKDEVLVLSNFDESINENLKKSNNINIKGKEYQVKNNKVIEENLETFIATTNFCTIVINDEFLSDYKISKSVLNVMYSDKNREENNKKYKEISDSYINGKYKKLNIRHMNAFSKDELYRSNKSATTTVLFIGIYLGIVFLITSMAILALQQLSEASDSVERYKSLKRIGANSKMIDKTIFIQTFMYFSLPVSLALIHSVVGIKVVNDYISMFSKPDIRSSALITALIFIVVYAGYFYTTYTGYKNIVKSNI